MNKPQLISSFAKMILKPVVSQEKDKYLAVASLDELKKFIPNFAPDNVDLLPIAFNACVINRVNKNRDIIDTATAVGIAKNFIYKPINVEHDRSKVIGMILNYGFSEFGSDMPLTEEEVLKKRGEPFNITLGGVIWKVVCPKLAEHIEESADPSSPKYLSVSCSWELGFSDYDIVLMEGGKRNLSDASRVITSPVEKEAKRGNLISMKGSGKIDDLFAYRLLTTDVLPLGIGVTENPAAEVKGIAVQSLGGKVVDSDEFEEENESCASEHFIRKCSCGEIIAQCRCMSKDKKVIIEENSCEKCKNQANIISQAKIDNVKTEKNMKISSLQDISEASLKDVPAVSVASAVSDFISSELKKGSDQWEAQKNELQNKMALAETQVKESKEKYDSLASEMATIKSQLEALNKEKADREQVDLFNGRMSEVCAAFEFDEEAKAAVVEDIRNLATPEDFNKWMSRAKVLFKAYAKKACAKKDEGQEEKAQEDKKKMEEAKASAEAILDGAKEQKGGLPNGASADQTLADKARVAFAKENITIK